jgi:hypothetical protein
MFSGAAHANGATMRDDKGKGEGETGGPAKKDARQDRLKLALRENLKRRKLQARARSGAATGASLNDGTNKKPG